MAPSKKQTAKKQPQKKNEASRKKDVAQRTQFSLEQKIDFMKRVTSGQAKKADIVHETGMAWSTFSTMYKNRAKILAASGSAAPGMRRINPKQRPPLSDEMEKLLMIWIEEKAIRGEPVSTTMIQEKARRLYEELHQNRVQEDAAQAAVAEDAEAAGDSIHTRAAEPAFTGEFNISVEVQLMF
jgi:hypothetical protein